MKGCILVANFEGQGWSSRLFTVLLILTWEMRYPQKTGINRKRKESFRSCSAWDGDKLLTLGKEGFAWGARGRGKLDRLIIKQPLSKTVVRDFPYTFKSSFQ